MDDLIITDTSVDEISPEKKYSQQRQKAHSFEMLAFNIYTGDYIGDLHTDERRFLLEQLGLLAREAKLFSFQLCDTVATEIEEVIQSALTSAGHNRFDFLKMLIGNICDAARSSMNEITQYDTQGVGDKIFENLVSHLLAQGSNLNSLCDSYRQHIIDDIKLLAHETKPQAACVCAKIALDVYCSSQKAPNSSSDGFHYMNMVLEDILAAVKSMAK
ncbi:uncharacterized protein IWZ02DRAFT_494602 [Phyllosticta citriasiana]|uniref:uncharacterized protein n=1 Tax=Phyllosticta citriasiana TaxID=595635 RepID=UPI0030FD7F84